MYFKYITVSQLKLIKTGKVYVLKGAINFNFFISIVYELTPFVNRAPSLFHVPYFC